MSLWDEGRLGVDGKQIPTSSYTCYAPVHRKPGRQRFSGAESQFCSQCIRNVFWKWEVYICMHVCVHIYIHTGICITHTTRTQNVDMCVSWGRYQIWQRCGWRLKLSLNFCQVLWASSSPKQTMMISHTESLSLINQWSWKWSKRITLQGRPSVVSAGVFVRRLYVPVNLIYSSMVYSVRHFSWDICLCTHI